MWESLKTRATDFTAGGRFKRRGAKLGILIAIMVTLPGLVAATSFISGSGSGTLTATPSAVTGAECGFDLGDSSILDTNYITLVSGGSSEFGTSGIYSAVTLDVKALELGSSGYEYLDGEIDFACVSTPATGTTTVALTLSGSGTSGASIAVIDFEKIAESATVPAYLYCAPGADAPTAGTAYTGTCPTTGTAQTACDTTPVPNLFLPNNGDSTVGNWDVWNTVSGAAVSSCGTLTSFTVANAISATEYYGIVSFGLTGSLTGVSGTWGISAAITAT
jgi:hypothetical protein